MGSVAKNAGGGCCCGGPVSIGTVCVHVSGCGGTGGIAGGTVSIAFGGTTVGTATIDGTLKACMPYFTVGSYTGTITPPASACDNYVATPFTIATLAGGGGTTNVTKGLTLASGYSCCGTTGAGGGSTDIPNPTPLFSTYAAGTACQVGPGGGVSQGLSQCQWQLGGGRGAFTGIFLTYIGNCQWQIQAHSGLTVCTSTTSGPPTLPISLTFTAWDAPCSVDNGTCATNTILPFVVTS